MTLSESVKRTYLYSKVFDSSLTTDELHFWLASNKIVSKKRLSKNLLSPLTPDEKRIHSQRISWSDSKLNYCKRQLLFLSCFPFIQFIGVTGSVAAQNSKEEDDIDIMIITSPNTLWITRPLVLIALEVLGIRRNRFTKNTNSNDLICPNLWLDTKNLKVSSTKRSLYTAHEVLQVKPILNKNFLFEQFLTQNSWAKEYLANAYSIKVKPVQLPLKRNPLFAMLVPFNLIFFLLQLTSIFINKNFSEISPGKAYFHNPNFHKKVIKKLGI